jgi:Tfp pilus assembly protein PilF
MKRVLLYVILIAAGVVIGSAASSYLSERGSQVAAQANLLAAGESLRANDPVAAMTYAQSALIGAPDAYDGYEAVGDVYAKLGIASAARSMYRKAIERIEADGEGAMLVTKGMVSSKNAAELIRRKLNALGQANLPPQPAQ